ncbi:MAG: hypothetical protein R2689_00010 [Microthrixaceae bacterium]
MDERAVDPTTDVELVGDPGLTAIIAGSDWPIVGRAAAVKKSPRSAVVWPGVVKGFRPAKRLHIEWRLNSGEQRSQTVYDTDLERYDMGSHVPIEGPRYTWDGIVTDASLAVAVTIEYRIQSGTARTKPFFAPIDLPGYFEERPDGSAVLYQFRR